MSDLVLGKDEVGGRWVGRGVTLWRLELGWGTVDLATGQPGPGARRGQRWVERRLVRERMEGRGWWGVCLPCWLCGSGGGTLAPR